MEEDDLLPLNGRSLVTVMEEQLTILGRHISTAVSEITDKFL